MDDKAVSVFTSLLASCLLIMCIHTSLYVLFNSAHMLKFSMCAEFQHACWISACVLIFSMRAEFQHVCWISARMLNFSTRADFQHACWISARVLIFSMRADFQHACWFLACVLNFSMCAEFQHVCRQSACVLKFSTHAEIRHVLVLLLGNYIYSSFPLSVWQEIVFHARQTCIKQGHLLKQDLSETITPIDNSCMLLLNLSVNPIIFWCWCWSLLGLLLLK